MVKRKFVKDDYEDDGDQDSVDSQDSDDDYVPSPRETDNERLPPRALRATRTRSSQTTSGVRDRDGEEAQEEPSNGGAEVTSEDNTSAAVPQVRKQMQHLSFNILVSSLTIIAFTDLESRCQAVTVVTPTRLKCGGSARPNTAESFENA